MDQEKYFMTGGQGSENEQKRLKQKVDPEKFYKNYMEGFLGERE